MKAHHKNTNRISLLISSQEFGLICLLINDQAVGRAAKVKDGQVEEVTKDGQQAVVAMIGQSAVVAAAAAVMLAVIVAAMKIIISAAWDGMTSRALHFK